MTQPPYQPQQPNQPYGQQPHPQYYIPVKTGPSAGKVILWILLVVFVIIPVLALLAFLVIMQLT